MAARPSRYPAQSINTIDTQHITTAAAQHPATTATLHLMFGSPATRPQTQYDSYLLHMPYMFCTISLSWPQTEGNQKVDDPSFEVLEETGQTLDSRTGTLIEADRTD